VEEYVRYVVRTWGQDRRILLWDLYNEPGNPWIFRTHGTELCENTEEFEQNALLLMEKVFQWAREENPSQPLTTSAWHMPDPFFEGDLVVPLAHAIDQRAMELSDVITIHAYCDPACLQTTLMEISHFGKPMLLTEWMARQVKSTYEETLPTLKELKVGAYQWGLVKGKTQTHLPWPHGKFEHVFYISVPIAFDSITHSLLWLFVLSLQSQRTTKVTPCGGMTFSMPMEVFIAKRKRKSFVPLLFHRTGSSRPKCFCMTTRTARIIWRLLLKRQWWRLNRKCS
jgi:hypothetical protein